jgi:kynurenine 3-monooxygenase
MPTVAVAGAGLVGALMALGLAHRGYEVTLIDMRPDMRQQKTKNLRSINLAVSDRGIRALEFVDKEMSERVLKDIIPMYGRMIHTRDGRQESQKYGLFGEHINSIDRAELNENLLDELEHHNSTADNKIELVFNEKVGNLKFSDSGATLTLINTKSGNETNREFDFVVGADGSFSAVRHLLQKNVRMNYTQEYVDKCYLELYIPPGPNGGFSIDANHLHIWPRGDFMLIALANADGSFTSTFFGPWELTESLATSDASKIREFFKENFPDAADLIGLDNVVPVFQNNPKGALMQVTCSQYHFSDKCIIIGDAAHSMVPFYGQGMNCGFEDVRTLLQLLDTKPTRKEAFSEYTATRHEDLKAILKLALDNYNEMSTKVVSQAYLFRKTLDGLLGRVFPQSWIPLYTMVSFRGDIPYAEAIKRENFQQRVLKWVEYGVLGACAYAAYTKFKK